MRLLDRAKRKVRWIKPTIIAGAMCVGVLGVTLANGNTSDNHKVESGNKPIVSESYKDESIKSVKDIPEYSGELYITINNNNPSFEKSELTTTSFEYYSELDSMGRCGVAYACIGQDIMPTKERGSIGQVKPTGWHTVKYDFVDGLYLYNRCHLIAYHLTGENANTKNLITGTRQMNAVGMVEFENKVGNYVRETGNHVMYRVTPVFEGDNLLATGVQMEAYSVEDKGKGICFNVFVYNVQDGVELDYRTGNSKLTENETENSSEVPKEYAVNNKNGKIHIVGECSATGGDSGVMPDATYFDTYEKALAYSKSIEPNQDKRDCGNCW